MEKNYLKDSTLQLNTLSKAIVSGYKHCAQETLKDDKVISTTGMSILLSIYCEPNLDTISKIATKIYVSKGLVSREVEKLKTAGFLLAESDEYDRRMVRLSLSDSVVPIVEKQIENMEALTSELFSGLTNQEIRAFFIVASRIQKNLNSLNK